MPLLPMWSGIILFGLCGEKEYTVSDSNVSVENWFRIVQHSILNYESRLKAAYFIRSMYIK